MTHDELLEEIDKGEHHGEKVIHGVGFWGKRTAALRAVVEVHKPVFDALTPIWRYSVCSGCNMALPCPTIQAIEKELK